MAAAFRPGFAVEGALTALFPAFDADRAAAVFLPPPSARALWRAAGDEAFLGLFSPAGLLAVLGVFFDVFFAVLPPAAPAEVFFFAPVFAFFDAFMLHLEGYDAGTSFPNEWFDGPSLPETPYRHMAS